MKRTSSSSRMPRLSLELPDLRFDLLADAIALLLEQPDLAFDLALDDVLPELQETHLPPDLLLEFLEGRQSHDIPSHKGIPHDKILTFLKHPGVKDQPPWHQRPTR